MKLIFLNSTKIQKILFSIIYSILFFVIFHSIFIKFNISNIAVSSSIIFLSLLPFFIENKTKLFIPPFFKSSFLLFIFGSLFLGETMGFYSKFFWWDIILHFSSAVGLGIIGFIFIHSLTITNDIKYRKYLNFVFSLSFAVLFGVIWEFIEFLIDIIFKIGMQDSNTDTMHDLLIDTSGALLGSYAGFLYLSKKKHYFLVDLLKNYFHKNFKNKIKRKLGKK